MFTSYEERILSLEKANTQKEEIIKRQLKEIESLIDENKLLKEAVEKLRKELRKYLNENTPSGSIPPYLKKNIVKKVEKEKRGDEKKINMRNNRPKNIDRIESLKLDACPCCGGKIVKRNAKSITRVVIKLQMPTVENVKYVRPRYYCPNCKKEVLPSVPDALPKSKFDLTTAALTSTLFTGMNLTHQKISELLSLLGLKVSKASVCNILMKLKEYLGDEYEVLNKKILDAKSKCKDETGWRHNGKINWVWVATTASEVCYWIEEKRNYKTVKRIFKNDKGVDTVDGYKGYDELNKPIQRDWAHLFRKAKNPEHWFTSKKEEEKYDKFVRRLVRLYYNAKKTKTRNGVSKELKESYNKKLLRILTSTKSNEKNIIKLSNYIMRYSYHWFTFLEYKDVKPTSNDAERALRQIVIKRKISQQTRCEDARQSYAMQMSLYGTSKMRGQNYMDFLMNVITDKLKNVG